MAVSLASDLRFAIIDRLNGSDTYLADLAEEHIADGNGRDDAGEVG